MLKRDPGCGAQPGASPSQGRCPKAQAARPCPSEPSGKGGSHAPKASGSLSRLHAELQARPAPTSSAPGGHAQTALVTRPPAPLPAHRHRQSSGKEPESGEPD